MLALLDRTRGAMVGLGGVVRVVAARAGLVIAKVADTDPAVHAAGRDQLRCQRVGT